MPKSETFSAVDAAWLHMDKPTNMALITGVMMFDAPLDFERLKATYQHRLLPFFPRFQQRVREPRLGLGLPRWETDPDFDLDAHLHRVRLPRPGDEAALQKLAGELMSQPLDFERPLWQAYLVDGYRKGSALIHCIHHCVADGLALVQVLLSLADAQPDAPWPAPPDKALRRRRRSFLGRLFAGALQSMARVRSTTGHMLHEGMEALLNPLRPAEQVALGASYAIALSKVTLLSPDRKTLLKGPCGVTKRATWSRPLPLDEVKAVGKALNGTVNDVLLAAAVGGLRRYLEARNQPVRGLNLRALVPINLRPVQDLSQLGNRFGLALLTLPVGVKDPVGRIQKMKAYMDEIKDTPEAVVAFSILGGMGLTPAQIEDWLVRFFTSKASAVMTNVPGPRETLYFAGRPLRGIMFWVPQPGDLALGVSILSYAGDVRVGVASDEGLIPDPEAIVAGFEAEFQAMQRLIKPAAPRQPARRKPAPAARSKTPPGQAPGARPPSRRARKPA